MYYNSNKVNIIFILNSKTKLLIKFTFMAIYWKPILSFVKYFIPLN